MVTLARVRKLEAQKTSLLHHIQPWMYKPIIEVEDRIKKWVDKKAKQRIQKVHKRLDAFELQVLARLDPSADLPTIQVKLAS